MKVLIADIIEPNRLGELVTAAHVLCDKPDILAFGKGDVPGVYNNAYQIEETIGANLISSVAGLIQKENYDVVLFSATTLGSGIAAPLSVRLSASLLSEVTGFTTDLVVERPVYGGKAIAKYKVTGNPVIMTIRRNSFEKTELEGYQQTGLLEIEEKVVKLISEHEEKNDGIPLEDADIVVTGGRGLGDADNFSMLKELATLLGGAVGASRGAVDEGWMPPTMQVGQTGKIVAPNIYFAVGVSGASQHLAGITNAKCVVAINKDEEANIFNRARFGITEDYKKVLPGLIKLLREEQ